MKEATHDTFVIERTYKASPERVFAAWSDPAQKRRWFGDGSHVISHELDFREGGFERTRFKFPDGGEMTNTTLHHDIVTNRRIVTSYDMTVAGARISVSLLTIELERSGAGTKLTLTEQSTFFEGGDGTERRKAGWTELLGKLDAGLG